MQHSAKIAEYEIQAVEHRGTRDYSCRHLDGAVAPADRKDDRTLRRDHLPRAAAQPVALAELYRPSGAHMRAMAKRSSRGRTERLKSDVIRSYVIEKIRERWSPEQVAGRLKKDTGLSISHEAIYQFIYAQIPNNGLFPAKPGCLDLRPYLRRKRPFRRRQQRGRGWRAFKPLCRSIDERPSIVDTRERVGDWESDSVVSGGAKPGLNTVVERKIGHRVHDQALVLQRGRDDPSAGVSVLDCAGASQAHADDRQRQ